MSKEELLNAIPALSTPGVYELIVREDKAQVVREETPVNFTGNISSPIDWLRQRSGSIDLKKCNVVVNREGMKITLTENERDHYKNVIVGELIVHPTFVALGINDGKFVTAKDLANRLRKHRSRFETISEANIVIGALSNFSAKVQLAIDKADDKRGNTTDIRTQAVESNIPKSFILNTPLLKGGTVESLEVSVEVDARDLSVTIFSEDMYMLLDAGVDRMINEVVDALKAEFSELVILEQ